MYDALCSGCGATTEYQRSVDDRWQTPECPECGSGMSLAIFTAPKGYVRGKFEAFRSSVDGTVISNHLDMREHNKRNGVECLADGYSEDRVRAGSFQKQDSSPISTKEELIADIAAAAYDVRNGYKPEVQHDD